MQVLDNFLPKDYEEKIKKTLLSNVFPWYFIDDVTSPYSENKRPGLNHVYVSNSKVISPFFDEIKGIISYSKIYWQDKYHLNNISLSRSFLQFPLNNIKNNIVDNFHIDQIKKHIVFLYYVDDSDGDTLILEKKYNGISQENVSLEDSLIIKSVTPKKGRLVIFDGSHYHSAEQPSREKRCVINFNLD